MGHLTIFCDAKLPDSAMQLLREGTSGHRLVFPERPTASVLAVADVDPAVTEADVILGQPATNSVLATTSLRWLQVTSAGFTRYDTPAFREAAAARGWQVTNSSSVYAESCAQHVLAFMLAQTRSLPAALSSRCGNGSEEWIQLRSGCVDLRGQHVVILGFGSIAARLVELLAPFAMKITAMRRTLSTAAGMETVAPEKVEAALATADHVINILPENADSIRFINSERLGQMKQGVIFYNIGRGTTVDQDALADSLIRGHLGAAWLDVTDPEPLPDNHRLWCAPRCHITPHLAGGHAREAETLVRHFLINLQSFKAGSPMQDRIM